MHQYFLFYLDNFLERSPLHACDTSCGVYAILTKQTICKGHGHGEVFFWRAIVQPHTGADDSSTEQRLGPERIFTQPDNINHSQDQGKKKTTWKGREAEEEKLQRHRKKQMWYKLAYTGKVMSVVIHYPGDTKWMRVDIAPADWPNTVISSGSPPKEVMCDLTHFRASCWSNIP